MPHTSRQKRPSASAQKRLQVTSSDGWTHVTSSNNVRRVMRTYRCPPSPRPKGSRHLHHLHPPRFRLFSPAFRSLPIHPFTRHSSLASPTPLTPLHLLHPPPLPLRPKTSTSKPTISSPHSETPSWAYSPRNTSPRPSPTCPPKHSNPLLPRTSARGRATE